MTVNRDGMVKTLMMLMTLVVIMMMMKMALMVIIEIYCRTREEASRVVETNLPEIMVIIIIKIILLSKTLKILFNSLIEL